MRQPPLRAQIFGLVVGFMAVVAVQVAFFGDPWTRAALYGAVLTAGALLFTLILRSRR